MEISHTVHFSSNDNVEKQLDDLGFEYDREPFFDTYTIKIRVFESDAR